MKSLVASLALVALVCPAASAQYAYYYAPATGPTYYTMPTPAYYPAQYSMLNGYSPAAYWRMPAYSGWGGYGYGYRYPGVAGFVPPMNYYAPYINYGGYGWNFGSYPISTSDYLPRTADVFVHDAAYYPGGGGGNSQAMVAHSLPPLAPGTALITLEVRPDAEVSIQGQAMKQTGSMRTFVTPAMNGPGSYTVNVKWKDAGKDVQQTHTIDVRPGDRSRLTVIG